MADVVIIKTINYRGGNTVVRYVKTCECGCQEKAFVKHWPSKKQLTEQQVLTKIANEN